VVCPKLIRLAIPLILFGLQLDFSHANVLHSVDVVTDHPAFSIILIKTKSAVSDYRFIPMDGGKVCVDMPDVSRGDAPREKDIGKGAIQRVRVEENREKHSTQVIVHLQPGVPTGEVVHRPLCWNGSGQIILLVDQPQGVLYAAAMEDEAKRLRAEGKRIVIIDPGHGWLDPGCQNSAMGLDEKTIVLDIGRKLTELINQTGNMKAYLTRDGDYLPVMTKDDYSGSWKDLKSKSLSARLEFARRMHGEVFVSLHLNWCPGTKRRAEARGFEIFCLGRDGSQSEYDKQIEDVDNSDLAALDLDLPDSQVDAEVGKLLFAMQRDITMEETALFVEYLKTELLGVRGLVPRDPPIKTRGFRVLRTLAMPSALVELAFLSNPQDARNLKTTEFRWKLARSLYEGIASFFQDRSNGDVYKNVEFEPQKVAVPNEEYDIHVVKKGESLFTIAEEYGTNVTTLQKINSKGRGTSVLSGEEIKIPKVKSAPLTESYTVRSGDTLFEVSRRYGTSINELMKLNRLKSGRLQPGQKIQVPAHATAQSSQANPPSPPSPSRTAKYRIQRGDSLHTIAQRYETTVSRLKVLNGIRSDSIKPGQQLLVPVQ